MKRRNRALSLVLVFALALSLLTVSAFAKTSSDTIAAPAGDAVVFSIQIGTKTVNFTWNDINGQGAYATTSGAYGAKVDNELTTQDWSGVLLSSLLTAAEEKLGLTLKDSDQISAVAADGYVSAFTVGDVRDADNRYLVAPDPVSNYDGDVVYDNTYVRILRGDESTTANQANIRCVTGIVVTDANGQALSTGGKTQGGDVENAVFYIAVKESADSAFKFYYYTREDLAAYDNIYNFDYNDHSVDKIVAGRGASLANLLADITDADITDEMIVQYAESDGYHADQATAIEDSDYKDKVGWLTDSHVAASGDTAAAVETVICLTSWTTYDNPTENNVNSTQWEDADLNSGYLRAYRQRGDANSAVIKTVMGVVVSYDGQQFTGKDGYTLSAQSVDGNAMRIIEPSTGIAYTSQSVTGLVPGMQWTVSAPTIAGATVSGAASQTVTAQSGTDAKATFTYQENPYLTVDQTVYTLSALEALPAATQTPTKEEVSDHGTPYGYYDAMYYRYTGVWLKDLVSGDVTVTGTDGSALVISADQVENYFVACGYTASKSDTNVSEGKRYTYAYEAPRLIVPGDGTLVGEAEVGAQGNKMVTVAVSAVVSVSGAQAQTVFADLGSYGWAKDAIEALSAQGVVNGDGTGNFLPGAKITRGDFMLMLYRAYGLQASGSENFADVPADSYYAQAIAAAKALGIAQGDGENFRPTDPISRQEAMTLIYRTLTAVGKDLASYTGALDAFDDSASVADWASQAVSTLVAANVIQGSDGKINPNGDLTRAEMAVALYRALENIK